MTRPQVFKTYTVGVVSGDQFTIDACEIHVTQHGMVYFTTPEKHSGWMFSKYNILYIKWGQSNEQRTNVDTQASG